LLLLELAFWLWVVVLAWGCETELKLEMGRLMKCLVV
jgi:hypothetical protein